MPSICQSRKFPSKGPEQGFSTGWGLAASRQHEEADRQEGGEARAEGDQVGKSVDGGKPNAVEDQNRDSMKKGDLG